MALLLQEMILVIRTWHNKAVTLINDSPQGYIPALIHQGLSPSTCDTHNEVWMAFGGMQLNP